jgi:uncharacterized integral membrane protein
MSTFKSVIAITVPVLLAIIIFQNTAAVRFRLLFWSVSLPQIVLIAITALLGTTLGYLIASYQQISDRKKTNPRTRQGGRS